MIITLQAETYGTGTVSRLGFSVSLTDIQHQIERTIFFIKGTFVYFRRK